MAAAGWSRLAGLLPFVIASLLYGLSAAAGEAAPHVAYHYSTIKALLRGLYDGDMTIADLTRHGDHGLGTVNGLDGELIIVDGTPYQMRADGVVRRLQGSEGTPFAVVASFHVDREVPLPANLDMSGNFLIAAVMESLGEALALVGKAGIDRRRYLDILTSTLFGAPVYSTYGDLIAEGAFEPAGFAAHLGQGYPAGPGGCGRLACAHAACQPTAGPFSGLARLWR